jgi:hypothetical protein
MQERENRPVPSGNDPGDWARWYAEALGWRVLPLWSQRDGLCQCAERAACTNPGKHPRISSWTSQATSDVDQIARWWRQWPDAGVGILTGAPSGIVVIDVDRSAQGEESLAALERKLGKLPDNVQQLTGGGGRHLIFAHPGDKVITRAGAFGEEYPGVDTRADGGQIVAHPTVHASGRRYEWELSSFPGAVPFASLPPKWLEALVRESLPREASPLPGRIREHTRNDTLTSLAGSMRRRGASEEAIYAALAAENALRCDPPLDDREVRQIARSVSRYAPALHIVSPMASQEETATTAPDASADARPLITAGEADLALHVDEVWDAIHAFNNPPRLFRHGGILVGIGENDRGDEIVLPHSADSLRVELAHAIRWFRAPRGGVPQAAKTPIEIARIVLARPHSRLPALTRLVRSPVVGPEGEILVAPGYHPAARLYYAPDHGFVLPSVSEAPDHEVIQEARRFLLDEWWGDFPFVDDASRAHAAALLLLPFVRDLIDGHTPLHLINKPAPGTGAGLLIDVISLVALGRPAAVMTEARDEDEWRKRLTAALREAPTLLLLDNVHSLDSPSLSAAITAIDWSDRILGESEMRSWPVRCVWVATGNNPSVSPEVMRRTISIRLDAGLAHPWERQTFTHPDLRAWTRENRGRLVWAVLTLVRAWVTQGRPKSTVPPPGNFEAWAAVIGGILEVAGIQGFLRNASDFYERSDSEGDAWTALVEAWWSKFGVAPKKAADLLKLVEQGSIDFDLGRDTHGRLVRFGSLLRRAEARRFVVGQGSMRLTVTIARAGSKSRATLWRLISTTSPSESGES